MVSSAIIYKICARTEWREAERAGQYLGSAADLADGFIHLSATEQVQGTADKHFAGQADLVLVSVSVDRLAPALRWEPSRGGVLFPHLYGPLPLTAVVGVVDLPLGADGIHHVPRLGDSSDGSDAGH